MKNKRAALSLFIWVPILFWGGGCDRSQPSTIEPTKVITLTPSLLTVTEPEVTEIIPSANETILTSTHQSLEGGEPATPQGTINIPLGIGVSDQDDVTFFNKYAGEQDVIGVRSKLLYLLDHIEIGKKMLVLSPHDQENDDVIALVNEAKGKGVKILGFNLETALEKGELIEQEIQMKSAASEAGLMYAFGPTLQKLSKFYKDFAPLADIIILQSQRFQTTDDYEQKVEKLIANIKSANPSVLVWVQVSVNPPEKRDATPEEIVNDILLIADHADLIWIYFTPQKASIMEDVFKQLRP